MDTFNALYFKSGDFNDASVLRPQNLIDLHPNLIALVAFLAVALVISLLIDELARLAQEQAVLRRVATLAVGASPAGDLFGSVAAEIGDLFAVDLVLLSRYRPDATVVLMGSWRRTDEPVPVGTHVPLGGDNLTSHIARTGRPGPVVVALPEDMLRERVETVDAPAYAIVRPHPSGAEMERARSELTASRARIVAAADETRRRIERDLHDGAQQRLVSLGLELRATESSLPADLTDARSRMADTLHGLQEVVEGIQEISRGIHPAVLSRGGLGPAVKALARRSAVPVELDVRGDRRLPDPIEVAVYYVVSEALTNAAKHAHASVVAVTLVLTESSLQLTVADDGIGGADPGRGSGLVGLSDRIAVLGGALAVVSPAGAGTTLQVAVPIDPPGAPGPSVTGPGIGAGQDP